MPINRKGSGVAPGNIDYFAASTPPAGWVKANGAALSRTTYAALFAVIGTVYGAGDGSTTFNVPDLRGEFVRGWDDARGVDSGRSMGTAQTDQMQGHKHETSLNSVGSVGSFGTGGTFSNTADGSLLRTSIATLSNTPYTDGVNGAPRFGAETRPRNVSMLACIKY